MAVAQQLPNPVALFSVDNNGTIIELPSIPAAGAATVAGSLIFGIGTQANNALGSAKVLATDPITGYIVTNFDGQELRHELHRQRLEPVLHRQQSLPAMYRRGGGLLLPADYAILSATLQGTNNTASASFSIANADQLLQPIQASMPSDNVAAPGGDPSVFAWGLPFFYGRHVYTAIETRHTPGGTGPYFAF